MPRRSNRGASGRSQLFHPRQDVFGGGSGSPFVSSAQPVGYPCCSSPTRRCMRRSDGAGANRRRDRRQPGTRLSLGQDSFLP